MSRLTTQEASTAIYVDFESLGNQLARPAILGSLVIDDNTARFQQFVLDEALTGAVVARKDVCVATTPEDAVLRIVEAAERESRVVVSWSMHDCAVVRATCSESVAVRFAAVHRNALDTARPWKRRLYPEYTFVLKPFGGKHPLKEYMRMIGYATSGRLRPANPAKWLKHTLMQLASTAGRYRAITSQAKRDWHKLLEYNEHDCRGMREVIMRAANDLERPDPRSSTGTR